MLRPLTPPTRPLNMIKLNNADIPVANNGQVGKAFVWLIAVKASAVLYVRTLV